VLFADVKGSMELAEQLDPEAFSEIMQRFFSILSEGVERFEGFVDKFTGDGIMALFGAPIAHEDHARRACYAALHLLDGLRLYANELRLRLGLNFSARIGLNSGEVIVGKIGDDMRMDYTAQGHTVGLTSRMEQIAEPGKVYLTGHTAALIEGYFALADLGAMEIKGVKGATRVYELQGLGQMRTRLDVSRSRGFSRFVGRGDEMRVRRSKVAHTKHCRLDEVRAHLALARTQVRRADEAALARAEQALVRAHELIEEIGARAFQPVVHECRARLARVRGDAQAADSEIEEARRLYAAMGATAHTSSNGWTRSP
jgi:class 3 adenylate cyclase